MQPGVETPTPTPRQVCWGLRWRKELPDLGWQEPGGDLAPFTPGAAPPRPQSAWEKAQNSSAPPPVHLVGRARS